MHRHVAGAATDGAPARRPLDCADGHDPHQHPGRPRSAADRPLPLSPARHARADPEPGSPGFAFTTRRTRRVTDWIFKVGNQTRYPDRIGSRHVYDNTHSTRVAVGDSFVYLDKRGGAYQFIGHGRVAGLPTRPPTAAETRNARVRTMYEAKLADYIHYATPVDIRPHTVEGRRNRARLRIANVNALGWSFSIARLAGRLFDDIVDLAYSGEHARVDEPPAGDHAIPDAWSRVRRRHRLEQFRRAVLRRQNHTCAICGTRVAKLLDAAHVSDYSTDTANRANPANGIALCVYCHRAFDRALVTLHPNGRLEAASALLDDPVAALHFEALSPDERRRLLDGVDLELLRRRNRIPADA